MAATRKMSLRLPVPLVERVLAFRDGAFVVSERDAVVLVLQAGLDALKKAKR